MDNDAVKLLLAEQIHDSLDYRILPHYGMQDIFLSTLQAYRQKHATLHPAHHWSELDNITFLKEIRAWGTDRETGEEGLTVAGLLMFGKFQSIQDELPHYALDYQERPDAKTEARWIDRIWLDGSWSGNLYDFYRKVYPKLIADLKISFSVKDGLRDEDPPVHIALREALANTLIHADYRQRARVLVVKRPDMFGFQNPGEMRIPLELAIKGEEPDARNKRLAHLFGFVNIGEKAGTGIPKILAGWKSEHWRKPSLTEEFEPSPRTILRLQMLDFFPPKVLDLLKLYFKEQFTELDEYSRIALAITLSEGRLSHARLVELTGQHPSDVTKTLKMLVQDHFLVSEGKGKGTIYRFEGAEKITSDDVFSNPSSPNLNPSSPNLNPSSPNLNPSSPNSADVRDENGRFITKHFAIPFVDTVDDLKPDFLKQLERLAELPRTKKTIARDCMIEVILKLCQDHYISLDCLAKITRRKPSTLQGQYLTQLCKEHQLKMAFPDKPTDPRQAYTLA